MIQRNPLGALSESYFSPLFREWPRPIILFQLTLLKIRNILNEIVSLFSINDVRNVDEQIITDGLEIMF